MRPHGKGHGGGVIAFPPTGEHNEQDAGDHKGPPSPSPPPSPLRTDEHVSKKLTPESTTPAPTRLERGVLQYSLTIRLEELT